MYKSIVFNPFYTYHKTPNGAVPCGEEISLNLQIIKEYNIYDLRLIVKDDFERIVKNININKSNEDDLIYNIYRVTFSLKLEGIYWYYFECTDCYGTHFIASINNLDATMVDYLPLAWQINIHGNFIGDLSWFKGKVMYQIMVDRFNKGSSKEIKPNSFMHQKWNEMPHHFPLPGYEWNTDFFGGDIQGIINKLDYLKDLNVSVIYLNPIFLSPSNHKYDTSDYMSIDPMFGTEEDFKNLCLEAKKRDMYIILDGAFNHTGQDSIYFNRFGHFDSIGAYQSKESPYYSWYKFIDYPNKYESWWGFCSLPSVNQHEYEFLDFITGEKGVIKKWLRLGAKGFRLDVVDELNDNFVNLISKAVKTHDKNSIVIGEVWEDASNKVSYSHRRQYFNGHQLDSVMNYPFKTSIIDYLLFNNCDGLKNRVRSIINNYPKHVLDSLMNIVDTHDTVRILNNFAKVSVFNMSKDRQAVYKMDNEEYINAVVKTKMASAIQFMLPGIPSIFYGDEIGLQGYMDPFCRSTMPWDNMDKDLLSWYKLLGNIRKDEVFVDGEYKELYINKGIYSFSRENKNSKYVIIVNNNNEDFVYENINGVDMMTNNIIIDKVTVYKQTAKIIKCS